MIATSLLLDKHDISDLKFFLEFTEHYLETLCRINLVDNFICVEISKYSAKVDREAKSYDLCEVLRTLGVNPDSASQFKSYQSEYNFNLVLMRNLRRLIFMLCVRKLLKETLNEQL